MSKKQLSKTEYLQQLEKYLNKLPKEDFEDAMEYFTEYFEDADDEGAQALMEELGTPKEAARDLMMNLLDRKLTDVSPDTKTFAASGNTFADSATPSGTKSTTGRKIWKSILWISLLVLFAIPIGAPGWPELAFCTASILRARMALASSLRDIFFSVRLK